MEFTTKAFQLDMASVQGAVSETTIKPPEIPVLQTRAVLPILLISWVCTIQLGLMQRETMSLGKTEEIWVMIERLAENTSARDIIQSLVLAGFDALSLVLKRSDMTTSTFQDPISEVTLYQSILVNRVRPHVSVAHIDPRSTRCSKR